MKIICITSRYYPAFKYGGPIFSIHALNKMLVKDHQDITVYTTNVGLEGKVPAGAPQDVDGVKVTYFPYNKCFEFMGTTGWQYSPLMAAALKKDLAGFDAAYITSVWNYPAAIAARACAQKGIPYVVSPRGNLYPYALRKKAFKKWLYYSCVLKKPLARAAAIHYTSDNEARECHSFLGLKNDAWIIPNGIDAADWPRPSSCEALFNRLPDLRHKKIILFMGRISWKKGLDILLPAFARLHKEHPDTHLLIAGNDEGGYTKKIHEWSAQYGIEKKLTLAGLLTGDIKIQAYTASSLFVLPSYSENFGMAVVEALVCGTPVVVSNKVAICEELLRDKAGLVADTNPESLYQNMHALLADAQLRETVSRNGKKAAGELYDIGKVAKRMRDAFNTLKSKKDNHA